MDRKYPKIYKILRWPFLFIWGNLYSFSIFICSLFPHPQVKKGDKFLVSEDIGATGLIHYKAPFTDGFKCTIPKGTILVAFSDSERISLGFGCIPENKEKFERKHIPENQRNDDRYTGYSFVFTYKEIGKRLKKL